ncbi:MAG: tRNA (adenosine(37)-N6)-dimethylallyltransferase MiaA, partial [Burkholderiales bacterium]
MRKNQAVLLMGPTATGKTELALRLASNYPIEIISVDSALIYTDMNIGTAKPTANELASVPHYLINIISPLETYSVAQFILASTKLIHEISQRGKLAVLVGGSMMYYNGLIKGISPLPEADRTIRNTLEAKGQQLGWEALHRELAIIDPIAANKIKPQDKQRIMRALEVYLLTGKPITQLQQEPTLSVAENIKFLPLAILPHQREILHQRIEARFEKMLQNGFIAEVEELQQQYPELTAEHTSMRCVGYSQVWQYLANQLNKAELIDKGKAATRQLAKRQITWLRCMSVIN